MTLQTEILSTETSDCPKQMTIVKSFNSIRISELQISGGMDDNSKIIFLIIKKYVVTPH